jgi:hypothetical protein
LASLLLFIHKYEKRFQEIKGHAGAAEQCQTGSIDEVKEEQACWLLDRNQKPLL